MFTIIIPLFNKSAFITKTLQSVFAQTFQKFEIIIINDGSTDNSMEVLGNYNFKNIDYKIINQENVGVSNTRNNGIKVAKYDYIAFLDADDWWEPNYLDEIVKLIESFPDAGLYASSYYKIKNDKKYPAIIKHDDKFYVGYIDYLKLYSKGIWMPVWTGATVVKKEVIHSFNGFKSNLKMGEDFDLWLRISQKFKIAFLNKPLSNYNQDVDADNRAIGMKFYKPDEHFLFQDYSKLRNNSDFVYLFEKLALYGLFQYFIFNKNIFEVTKIINTVHWKNHPNIWYVKYKIIPKCIHRIWLKFRFFAVKIKKRLI